MSQEVLHEWNKNGAIYGLIKKDNGAYELCVWNEGADVWMYAGEAESEFARVVQENKRLEAQLELANSELKVKCEDCNCTATMKDNVRLEEQLEEIREAISETERYHKNNWAGEWAPVEHKCWERILKATGVKDG